jgi:hypothetical protein
MRSAAVSSLILPRMGRGTAGTAVEGVLRPHQDRRRGTRDVAHYLPNRNQQDRESPGPASRYLLPQIG